MKLDTQKGLDVSCHMVTASAESFKMFPEGQPSTYSPCGRVLLLPCAHVHTDTLLHTQDLLAGTTSLLSSRAFLIDSPQLPMYCI